MLKKNQKLILICIVVTIFIVIPTASILAQNVDDNETYNNQYFSSKEIKRADTVIYFISSPEVVYTVLVTFSLLVVFATYFVIVGLIVIMFFA